MALAVVAALGAAARLLPASACALPFVPVIVSVTPWFAALALASLALSFVPAWHGARALRACARALAVACLGLELAWQGPFFVASARVSEARAALEREGAEANEGQAAANDGASEDDADASAASRAVAATAEGESSANANSSASTTNSSSDGSNATSLRVMTCNVYKGAADASAIVELVRSQGVRVLALQETTAQFVEALEEAGIDELLPYSERSSSDGVFGNGVWSAWPLDDGASDDIGSSASAMPAGTVALAGAGGAPVRLRFVSVHTCSPVPGYWNLWKTSLDELGVVHERLAQEGSPAYVLMGDFNATYDHVPFRQMLGQDGPTPLHDAVREAGQGIVATWPSNEGVPAFASIDHVVTSDAVAAISVSAFDVAGTDHLALVATLVAS